MHMISERQITEVRLDREAVFALVYFGIYLGTLFLTVENEAAHWITLVLLPFGVLYFWQRRRGGAIAETLASVGLRKDNLKHGLLWSLLVGLGLSTLQLFVSDKSGQFVDLIDTGAILYLLPLSFVFLLFTAAFTEEVFFRGILQTRLGALFGRRIWAIVATSFLFGLYHVPYAYLNPNWPSHGDFGAAFSSAMSQGMIGGLVLGWVYEKSDGNLVASILVHALINLLPAATMIKFGGG